MREEDLVLGDGRTLHFYDLPPPGEQQLAVFWHHGTPNIGRPPEPLFALAAELGIRWIGYDRPSYGGSSERTGRDVASAAFDVERIADRLGIKRFAVMGHSGGAPHALACAALLPERVVGAVSIAGLAPPDAEGLDWFKGMGEYGAAALRAAAQGRAAREYHDTLGLEFDREMFMPEDWEALAGPWSWFDSVVRPAVAKGPHGAIDDDVAYVTPWDFDCTRIACPVLFVHGLQDRVVPAAHSEWLAQHCRWAELWQRPDDGHLSVMNYAASSLVWLRGQLRAD